MVTIPKNLGAITSNFRNLACDESGNTQFISGIATLLVLVFPTLLMGLQFMSVGYAGEVVAGAAREGARAAAVGEDVNAAVTASSSGFDGRRWWTPLAGYPCTPYSQNWVTIQVTLEVPHVTFPLSGPLEKYPTVTSRATARCEVAYQSF